MTPKENDGLAQAIQEMRDFARGLLNSRIQKSGETIPQIVTGWADRLAALGRVGSTPPQSRGKPDRRQRDEPPCRCGHFRREHKETWDPEALKSFWFCSGCDREHKKYPATHHQPEVPPVAPVVGPAASEEPKDYQALYFELIYEVAIKHPGESRHETARRYIREREQPRNSQATAARPTGGSADV
jgi:hypothetical protein